MRHLVIPIIIAWALLISCNDRDFQKSNIRGTWSKVTNDSIYEEFIVTEKEIYTYDERAGDLFVQYKIDEDSMYLFWPGGKSVNYGFTRQDENRFTLSHPRFNSVCYRLEADIDTAKILSVKRSLKRHFDEVYFDNYLADIRRRKVEWLSKNRSR
jgi:hypothetical protein